MKRARSLDRFDFIQRDHNNMTSKITAPIPSDGWHSNLPSPALGRSYDSDWVRGALQAGAIAGGPPGLFLSVAGSFRPEKNMDSLTAKLKELGGKLVYVDHTLSDNKAKPFDFNFSWKEGMVEVFAPTNSNGIVDVSIYLSNQDLFEKVKDAIVEHIDKDGNKKTGRVSILSSTEYGPKFTSIGIGGHKIERDNYTPEVLSAYDKIIKDMKSPNPSGRLSIFNGPPGSGKTYLVKALISEPLNATCVIVPSQYVSELAGPNLINAFLDLRGNQDEGTFSPIMLVVEDADECLVKRDGSNMSSISTILNLCDGIIGSVLDIRIVTTTNADKMDLDKALTRPGRLSASMEVGKLPFEQAVAVLARIAPELKLPEEKAYSLAEVYNIKNEGSVTAKGIKEDKKSTFGFKV